RALEEGREGHGPRTCVDRRRREITHLLREWPGGGVTPRDPGGGNQFADVPERPSVEGWILPVRERHQAFGGERRRAGHQPEVRGRLDLLGLHGSSVGSVPALPVVRRSWPRRETTSATALT